MNALQRTVALLTWPAIAWLGTACDHVDTPTEPPPQPDMLVITSATLVVDDDGMAIVGDCDADNPTHMTITAAVMAASPGETIQVCPGTYTESVRITQPLTLRGPNAGVSLNETREPEATVTWPIFNTFDITDGEDVKIDGFTINGGNIGIAVTGSSNNLLIQSNITTGVLRALSLDAPGSNLSVLNNDLISDSRSLHVDGAYTNMVISGNRFSGPAAAPGIFFTGGTPHSITGFEFTDNEVLHRANMASNISDATVSGNTFDVDPPVPGNEILLISLQNSKVTYNIFEGHDEIACLRLWGDEFALVPSEHVMISENTFGDCGTVDPESNYAIQLGPEVHHIDIKNNEISDGVEGVNTGDQAPWDVTQEIHINFNNITDNTSFGVRNGQMGVLDAECNWWGAADGPGPVGPGSGDNVSTNVDFTPWLIAPAPSGACAGGFPSGGTVNGGGQINVTNPNGRGSFGFSANAARQRGHLNYMNHAKRDHLNCTVDVVMILSETEAHLEGTCSSKSAAGSFEADVEDNGEPGKNSDKFTITYGGNPPEGGTIRSGNIQIH